MISFSRIYKQRERLWERRINAKRDVQMLKLLDAFWPALRA